MASRLFAINLGPGKAGLTDLRAQLLNPDGSNHGDPISTVFTDTGSGTYTLVTDIAVDFTGSIQFYSDATPSYKFVSIAIEASQTSVPGSGSPDVVTLFTYIKKNGVGLADATLNYQQLADESGDSFVDDVQTTTSDDTGLVSFTAPRGSVYTYWAAGGRKHTIMITDATDDPTELESVNV